jgi:hypothetical protein
VAPFLEFIARINKEDNTLDVEVGASDMLCGSFFTGLPLACFVDIMDSTDLNVKLGCKCFPRAKFQKDRVSLFVKQLPKESNYRFWVIHNNGRKAGVLLDESMSRQKQVKSSFHKLQKNMVTFMSLSSMLCTKTRQRP